ncbi:hypothetical protein STCU_12040 [Strigomonas culicis]|uniref:Uncharacterized protein n=1 Tax=Strigomonas culicis TaxID=28005 RepID=S9TBL8_9TRYP|nr:hypothetical protein STCU_12040 [Strigomonas culicis]|eukprot:EPY15417.1 hypothetical protein STCU_12040 [Strigomonas culicis]
MWVKLLAIQYRLLEAPPPPPHTQPAQRQDERAPHLIHELQRSWGTTLSISIAEMARWDPLKAEQMLLLLQNNANKGTNHCTNSNEAQREISVRPLVLLDGHVLTAIENIAAYYRTHYQNHQKQRELLWFCKRHQLLDVFKIMRGLLSKHKGDAGTTSTVKWEEALFLFQLAMDAPATESHTAARALPSVPPRAGLPLLSRREIGQTRRNMLHNATLESLVPILKMLHRIKHHNDTNYSNSAPF